MTHDAAQHIHEADPPLHPNAVSSPWADRTLENRVRELWTEHSATEIRKIILDEFQVELTKSQVIGKVRRLGLTAGNKTKLDFYARNLGQKAQAERPKLRVVRASGNSSNLKLAFSIERDMAPLKCAEIEPLHLTLADLTDETCRYPLGDGHYTFCGQKPVKGLPYCPAHCAIAYLPPTERNQRAREQA